MNKPVNIQLAAIFSLFFLVTGCNTNHPTGSATSTLVGAGIGAGGAALLGGSKPVIAAAGLTGGAIGYYLSTLRHDSGGIIRGCGQVYRVGDYIGIYIPTDEVFEPNTDDFTPQAGPILDSAAAVLQRYPNNNIIVSGNTSGFDRPKRELRLSEKRAQKVSAYLWNAGINDFKENSNDTRKLTYVGYGDYFPIASTLTNHGIRENSRIQITSYPSNSSLGTCRRSMVMKNIGGTDDNLDRATPGKCMKDQC